MSKSFKIILAVSAVAVAAAGAWLFFRPAGTSGLLKLVPNNAFAIVKLNLPDVAKILEEHKDEVSNMGFMKDRDLANHEPLLKLLQSIITSPVEAGLNLRENAFFYVENTPRGVAAGLLFGLKDKQKFAALAKKHQRAGGDAGETEGIGYGEYETGTFLSWSENAALLSFNKTEGKAYCNLVLGAKNADKGSKPEIFVKTLSSSDIISGAILTDAIFGLINDKVNNGSDSVRNPFESGSAFTMTMQMKKASMSQEIAFISGKSTGKKPVSIFQKKGKFDTYSNQLFTREVPLYALNFSFDPKGIVDFITSMMPKDAANPQMGMVSEIIDKVWTGDITMGISVKSGIESGDLMGFSALENIGFAAHIGIKDGADEYLAPYLSNSIEVEKGIMTLPVGGFLFTKKKDVISISNDLNLLKTGKGVKTDFDHRKAHTDAPIYIAANVTEVMKMSSGELDQMPSIQKLMESYNGYQYMWLDGNKLHSEYDFKDSKTHPMILMLRLFEEIYQIEKKGKDPFREKNASLTQPDKWLN